VLLASGLMLAALATDPQPRIQFPLSLTIGVRYAVASPGSDRIYRWDIHSKVVLATWDRGGFGIETGYQRFPRGEGFYVVAAAEVCVLRCKKPAPR
jgi:hypothetical protein